MVTGVGLAEVELTMMFVLGHNRWYKVFLFRGLAMVVVVVFHEGDDKCSRV